MNQHREVWRVESMEEKIVGIVIIVMGACLIILTLAVTYGVVKDVIYQDFGHKCKKEN